MAPEFWRRLTRLALDRHSKVIADAAIHLAHARMERLLFVLQAERRDMAAMLIWWR
jgi:hypothetical protein